MPKYYLRLRKTSFLLMFLNSAMLLGNNKASSKDEATCHPIPSLKLLIEASSLTGSPLSMGTGSQASTSRGWLPPPLYPSLWGLGSLLLLCSSLGLVFLSRIRSPSFYYLLSFYSLFLFGSAGLDLGGTGGWGGGRGDLRGGGGSFGCTNFPRASLPSWDSIRSDRLLWFFLWMPISSEMMVSPCCWESRLATMSSKEGV